MKRITMRDEIKDPDGLTSYERYLVQKAVRSNTADATPSAKPDAKDADAPKTLSGAALFAYRETHGGKSPPTRASRGGGAKALGGRDLLVYKTNHGGKSPPSVGGAR